VRLCMCVGVVGEKWDSDGGPLQEQNIRVMEQGSRYCYLSICSCLSLVMSLSKQAVGN
jgi:hypothetical protein